MAQHKHYDQVFPYTYYVVHIDTGLQYYGVRWGNVAIDVAPINDLGTVYFTSAGKNRFHWFREEFKRDPSSFRYRVHKTFDTRDEALNYETQFISHILHRPDWINQGYQMCSAQFRSIRKYYSFLNRTMYFGKEARDRENLENFVQYAYEECHNLLESVSRRGRPEKKRSCLVCRKHLLIGMFTNADLSHVCESCLLEVSDKCSENDIPWPPFI